MLPCMLGLFRPLGYIRFWTSHVDPSCCPSHRVLATGSLIPRSVALIDARPMSYLYSVSINAPASGPDMDRYLISLYCYSYIA
jgi:hypothetical protein